MEYSSNSSSRNPAATRTLLFGERRQRSVSQGMENGESRTENGSSSTPCQRHYMIAIDHRGSL